MSNVALKMTVDEAIKLAAEWSRGMTMHADSQGWRVACMLLANEVVRLREIGWQPIDSAPKDGTRILVASAAGAWVAEYKRLFGSGALRDNPWFSVMLNHRHLEDVDGGFYPTHWMPLPAPPKERG